MPRSSATCQNTSNLFPRYGSRRLGEYPTAAHFSVTVVDLDRSSWVDQQTAHSVDASRWARITISPCALLLRGLACEILGSDCLRFAVLRTPLLYRDANPQPWEALDSNIAI